MKEEVGLNWPLLHPSLVPQKGPGAQHARGNEEMTQVAREGQAVGMQSFIPDHSYLKFPLLQEALTTPLTHPKL